jgi:hypothetical protein
MPKTKTPALLTVSKATSQARRAVDRIMPGVMATVESKLSHDLKADTALVVTTITFPAEVTSQRYNLEFELYKLSNWTKVCVDATQITITRKR